MRLFFVIVAFLAMFASLYSEETATEDSPAVQAAKRERERRARLKPGRTYTNKDIQEYVRKHPSIPAPPDSMQPQTQTQPAEAASADPEEMSWRAKHTSVSQRIAAAQARITQIQNDIDTLAVAFYEVADMNKKVEINDVRNKKLEELETAKTELEEANKAQDDLEDEARRSGVLPGWVRD